MANAAITFTSGEVSTYNAARVPHLKHRRAARVPRCLSDPPRENENLRDGTGHRAVVLSFHLRTRRRHSRTRSGSARRGLPDPEGRRLPAGMGRYDVGSIYGARWRVPHSGGYLVHD